MKRPATRFAFALLAVALGPGLATVSQPDVDLFVAVRSTPANGGIAFLNDPVNIDFTAPVDLSTADLNSVSFQVQDLTGTVLAEVPSGSFRLAKSSSGSAFGRRLVFEPVLAINNTYTNGGFRAGRAYIVTLMAGGAGATNVLRDTFGRPLARTFSFQFTTPTGTTPAELFRNPEPGGSRRVGFSVTRAENGKALLNQAAQTPVVVTLEFGQALNPHTSNIPVALNLCPTERSISNRGKVFLEYDDTEPSIGQKAWIPALVVLVRNNSRGAIVQLHPLGVLPNSAKIRVIVEPDVEDISGESNVGSATFSRIFAAFDTVQRFEPQFNAIVETFDTTEQIDLAAPILEPLAEINPGFVRSNFDFEGSATILDYQPTSPLVILNTDFTQITPKNGPPINVAGGVFQFRDVTIPAGVTVKGEGSNPMVWLVTGDFMIDGLLTVEGDDGERVQTTGALFGDHAEQPEPGVALRPQQPSVGDSLAAGSLQVLRAVARQRPNIGAGAFARDPGDGCEFARATLGHGLCDSGACTNWMQLSEVALSRRPVVPCERA